MKKLVLLLMTACLSLSLFGCVGGGSGGDFGFGSSSQGQVAIVDSSERNKLDTDIDLGDIIAFAENLTNKMLAAPVFANAQKPPRIILGEIAQNTHDENLRVEDIYDRIQEVLFNSGQVRVLDPSALSYDYIINPEITSFVARSPDGKKKVDYSMKIKLYSDDGMELRGQWSDDLSLFRGRE